MRISDWSSDVCSSDLGKAILHRFGGFQPCLRVRGAPVLALDIGRLRDTQHRIVRGVELGFDEIGGIGRGQRQRARIGEVDQRILGRSEEHTSELQSLMRISYAVFCLTKKIVNSNQSST